MINGFQYNVPSIFLYISIYMFPMFHRYFFDVKSGQSVCPASQPTSSPGLTTGETAHGRVTQGNTSRGGNCSIVGTEVTHFYEDSMGFLLK